MVLIFRRCLIAVPVLHQSMECRALLMEYRALLTQCRDLLTECRALLMECRTRLITLPLLHH